MPTLCVSVNVTVIHFLFGGLLHIIYRAPSYYPAKNKATYYLPLLQVPQMQA